MLETLKKIMRLVLQNAKYILLLVIFFSLLFFGKIIPQNEEVSGTFNKQNPMFGASSVITDADQSYVFSNMINSKQGDFYRILFSIRMNDLSGKLNQPISVFLESETGERKEIGDFVLNGSGTFQYKEFIFDSDKNYKNVIFVKNSEKSDSEVFIKDLNLSRLNITSYAEVNNLKKTIINNQIISTSSNANSDVSLPVYSFKRKHQLAGQIFKSDSDFISSVAMKLKFLGNGGYGEYHLVLKEATLKDNEITVSDSTLANFDFTEPCADQIYKTGSDTYQFPVLANVQPGKYYFLGISDEGVRISWLNYLQLLGVSTQEQSVGESGVIISKNGTTKKIGNLYLQVFNGNKPSLNGVNMLDGSIIQDLGGGEGIYSYNINNNNQDSFLNRTNISLAQKTEKSVIFDINTVYPFSKSNLSFNSIVGNTAVSYSFDGENWQNLTNESNQQTGTVFQIDGKNSNNVKIKFTFSDSNDQNYFFLAFKTINFNASLRIK